MKFDILLADCPFKYDNERDNNAKMGGMEYNTLSIQDLCNLNLSDIAEENSLLFSWSFMPKLKEGIEFIESNGFKYITCPFVWVKLNPTGSIQYIDKDIVLNKGIYSGLGSITAGNVELLLMGKRGKGRKRLRKDIKQVQFAPRGRHSEKPEIFQDMIEKLYGDNTKYIELFARRKRDNWLCIGNEITGNDIREDLKNIANI